MNAADAKELPRFLPLTRESIAVLVRDFYADVRADAELGPVFNAVIGDSWDAHLERMSEFWCTVVLRTRSFRGNVFEKHMALGGITPTHFARWMALWRAHTERLFEREAAQDFQTIAGGIGRMLHYGLFNAFPNGTVPRHAEAGQS